jgi:hypothetical protein
LIAPHHARIPEPLATALRFRVPVNPQRRG